MNRWAWLNNFYEHSVVCLLLLLLGKQQFGYWSIDRCLALWHAICVHSKNWVDGPSNTLSRTWNRAAVCFYCFSTTNVFYERLGSGKVERFPRLWPRNLGRTSIPIFNELGHFQWIRWAFDRKLFRCHFSDDPIVHATKSVVVESTWHRRKHHAIHTGIC